MPQINYLAVFLAAVAAMAVGSLWYSLKSPTGKIWLKELGFKEPTAEEQKKDGFSHDEEHVDLFHRCYGNNVCVLSHAGDLSNRNLLNGSSRCFLDLARLLCCSRHVPCRL